MATDYINDNISEALHKKISEAVSSEDIRQILVNSGERAGVLVRDRSGKISVRDEFVALHHTSEPLPSGDGKFMEVIYPSGNDRYEVCANSQQELDEKKRQIYALYGR